MSARIVRGLLLSLPILVTRVAQAQPTALDSLAARAARLGAVRYADRRVAVADGYRRVGTDFPGMGEHWLHAGTLLSGAVDPARPTLLVYAGVGGRPTLLGVGFIAITRGDSVARDAPGWPDAWHEHSGLLADESGTRPSRTGELTRVWVLHVWAVLGNPDGPYAPDNWALPFARLGVPVPPGVNADAGRAAGLLVGGDAYLREVLTDARLRDPSNSVTIDSAIAAARSAAALIVARLRDAGSATAADAAALRHAWSTLAASLRAALGPSVEAYVAPPHRRHATPGAAR